MAFSKPLILSETEKERLRLKLKERSVVTDSGCWLFRLDGEYGILKINNKVFLAHRVSYTVFKEDIPQDLLVCHTCDNPSCVNPDHLFTGTNKDNDLDMVKKNRNRFSLEVLTENGKKTGAAVGSKTGRLNGVKGSPNAKLLSDEEIREIRRMFANGASYKDVIGVFGITKGQCYAIKNFINYRNI